MDEDQIDKRYREKAKGILKSELARQGLSYKELAERLSQLGHPESERNLTNKISRGRFSMSYFLKCMEAIGVKEVRL